MKTVWQLSSKWLVLALVAGSLFLLYTAIYATGTLNLPTLEAERWLIGRPLTQIDCVFYEWRRLGTAPVSLIWLALLCVICFFAGYRKRVLPLLLILLLLGTGAELVGKKLFDLPLSLSMREGMGTLTCPQIHGQSQLAEIQLGFGMWWVVPSAPQDARDLAQQVSQSPLQPAEPGSSENGYPSGHAARWCFLGIIAAWLAQKHIRRKWLGWSLTTFLLLFSLLGAWIQFYVGAHFISDTIAGCFLGVSLASLAVILLILNDKRRPVLVSRDDWSQASTAHLPRRGQTVSGGKR